MIIFIEYFLLISASSSSIMNNKQHVTHTPSYTFLRTSDNHNMGLTLQEKAPTFSLFGQDE